jgi:hypothetical protein
MTLNKQEQDHIERAGKLSSIANREFLIQNRELLVSFDHESLSKAMQAIIRLDFRTQIMECEPDVTTYLRIQEQAFLSAFDRGAIQPIAEITSLGWDAVEKMRRETGIGVESLAGPTPTISAADQLRAEVISDWKNLSSKDVRAKRSRDKNYATMFKELSQTDALSSGPTTFTAITGA